MKGNGIEEEAEEVDPDELQDVVYDYDQTQALVERADDYLLGRNRALLSITGPEEEPSSIMPSGV